MLDVNTQEVAECCDKNELHLYVCMYMLQLVTEYRELNMISLYFNATYLSKPKLFKQRMKIKQVTLNDLFLSNNIKLHT